MQGEEGRGGVLGVNVIGTLSNLSGLRLEFISVRAYIADEHGQEIRLILTVAATATDSSISKAMIANIHASIRKRYIQIRMLVLQVGV